VHIDFTQPSVRILSIPRDFYVPIVDMAEHGITIGRINATYGYGEKFNGRGAGLISLADNIKYNFGVTFDHYIVLNLSDIAKYIDRISGVDLYLEKPVADGKLYFSAGDHHFDGETAVAFMRMRYFDDDFARVQRQSLLIKAFYHKAIEELNPLEQTLLVLEFILDQAIETDYVYRDIGPLTCLARNIDENNIHFLQVSKDMYRSHTTSAGGNVLIPNETVVPFIQSVMNGTYEP
jgi:LCP family protein required for cell wall assembly